MGLEIGGYLSWRLDVCEPSWAKKTGYLVQIIESLPGGMQIYEISH